MQDKGPSPVLKRQLLCVCVVYTRVHIHMCDCVCRGQSRCEASPSIALYSVVTGHRAPGILLSTTLTVLGLRAAVAPGFYMGAEVRNSVPGLVPGSGSTPHTDQTIHLPSEASHALSGFCCSFFFFPILILQINNTEH